MAVKNNDGGYHCFGLPAVEYAVSNICTNDGWDIDNTAMHIINRR
ncbi:MAG: hypothetical protein ACOX3X_06580 [Eubacteriales bacterium]|jgi:leucyl-tRNA synthetase